MAEAATPDMAASSALRRCQGSIIIDGHTHFLRDDTRLVSFVKAREAVGKAGWNKALADKEQTIDDLKYDNYIKEIYMDSDTKVALLSNSPSEVPRGLVHPAGAGVQDPRAGQQGGRHAAHDGAFHDHPGLARLARARSTRRSRSTSPIRGRATPSATTPTRSSPTIPSISTTRS